MGEIDAIFTDEWVAEWNRIRDKVDGIVGSGVTNTKKGISIATSPPVQRVLTANELLIAQASSATNLGGVYYGRTGTLAANSTFDPTNTGTNIHFYDFAATEDCVIVNWAEGIATTGANYLFTLLGTGNPLLCWRTGLSTVQGKPILHTWTVFGALLAVNAERQAGTNGTFNTRRNYTYKFKDLNNTSYSIGGTAINEAWLETNGIINTASSSVTGIVYLGPDTVHLLATLEQVTQTWPP